MSDRCTGHCCRALVLPHSPEELKGNPKRFVDGEFIADMLIPLAADDPALDLLPRKPREGWHAYTCRHLQPNGDCGVYATRPRMCSGYPYGATCEYKDCTCDSLRRPPIMDGFVVDFTPSDSAQPHETLYVGTAREEAVATGRARIGFGIARLNTWEKGRWTGSQIIRSDDEADDMVPG